jgi:hypothetical protein
VNRDFTIFAYRVNFQKMPPKKQGRKKTPIWLHFIEGRLLNSSHYEATCKYCSEKMGGVPVNMLKHLKEECSKISEELRNALCFDNTTGNKRKNKRSHVEINEEGNITFNIIF